MLKSNVNIMLSSTELQNDQLSLQEIIISLSTQLKEKETRNAFLTEKIKGIYKPKFMFFTFSLLIDLRSWILDMTDVLKDSHPLLSHKVDEPLTIDSKQEGMHKCLLKTLLFVIEMIID